GAPRARRRPRRRAGAGLAAVPVAAAAAGRAAGRRRLLDLRPLRRDGIPLSTELLALRVAGLPVERVRIQGVPGVGDLKAAVAALRGPEQRPGRARARARLAGAQVRRPGRGAGRVAGALPAAVAVEEVERPAARVDEDAAERRVGALDERRAGR